MKTILAEKIEAAVYDAAKQMCFEVDQKVCLALENAFKNETGVYSKDALSDILENISVAKNRHLPVCQDTGIVVAFVELGQNVHIEGDFNSAINNAISRAYKDEFLRKSVVKSPLERTNTKDNTPAIIFTDLVMGDELKITLCPKGAGSENMGKVKMLTPSDGENGIIDFVIQTIKDAGGKACPPLIVGVGIGGDLEKCALMSKKALLRDLSDSSSDGQASKLENTLLQKINALNIGAMGLGGVTTALAVKVELYPCHIASLPVAVSLMCHAARHATIIL